MKNLRYIGILQLAIYIMSIQCGISYADVQSTKANDSRTVVWRGVPISLTMQQGSEKVIGFPEDVQWSLPSDLVGLVAGEAIAGNLLLTTDTVFEKKRFRFRGIDSNRHYIVDLTSNEHGESRRIKIINEADARIEAKEGGVGQEERRPSGIAELTRVAFQSVYSPERLIKLPWDVTRVPIASRRIYEHLIVGAQVVVEPVAQWQSKAGDYAIAISIENKSNRVVEIDPRAMRRNKRWLSIAMINDYLAPMGVRGSKSALVIVSDGRWSEVSTWLH